MSNKDKEMQNQNDVLEKLFDGIGDQMLPPPELEKAVIRGMTYHGRVSAGVHVRKITGAIVAYAVCVLLMLGALTLLPKLFDTYPPVATEPITDLPSVTKPTEGVKLEYDDFISLMKFYEVFQQHNDYPIVSLQMDEVYTPKYRFAQRIFLPFL